MFYNKPDQFTYKKAKEIIDFKIANNIYVDIDITKFVVKNKNVLQIKKDKKSIFKIIQLFKSNKEIKNKLFWRLDDDNSFMETIINRLNNQIKKDTPL
jgi:hypothetical protein